MEILGFRRGKPANRPMDVKAVVLLTIRETGFRRRNIFVFHLRPREKPEKQSCKGEEACKKKPELHGVMDLVGALHA